MSADMLTREECCLKNSRTVNRASDIDVVGKKETEGGKGQSKPI